MNEKFIAAALALMSACVPASNGSFNPDINVPVTEPQCITEHFEINGVYPTYVEETDYTYYTVFGFNFDTGRTECIADDVDPDTAEDWLLTVGQKVIRVYTVGQPYYTGELFPEE